VNDAALKTDTQEIVVDEVFPHVPETIWKALTNGELIGLWIMVPSLQVHSELEEDWLGLALEAPDFVGT
jgi:uncharacterized protein YndB with AHSA1/START domain